MARLSIENLTKSFSVGPDEKVHAVQKVSLNIEENELMTLVGPSGSGKTTLLRLIAGLEEPDSGTITLDGTILNPVPPKDRDIAMVFQNYALYPHMTVYENLALGLKLRQVARTEIERRVREAAEMLGLAEVLQRYPDAVSGGQRQRVALGRALVRRAKVVLLDEPLSGLDARLRAQMRREIIQLQKQLGWSMLYVTHDQIEAMSLGHRIAVLHRGEIQQVATPGDLYLRPGNSFVAEFFGTPPMNFFCGTLVEKNGGLFFEKQPLSPAKTNRSKEKIPETTAGGFSLRLPEAFVIELRPHLKKQILLGIRPENIRILKLAAGQENEIRARTERIEMLGGETHLYFDIGTGSCVTRTTDGDELSLDEDVSLDFEMARAHFFDAETGQRIHV